MNVKPPTIDELRFIAADYHLEMSDDDLASFQGLITGSLAAYERIHELTEPKPEVKYPRTPGYRPQPDENPLNAWYVRTSITGADSGPLAGRTVAVKDNVCVAGVPMMNGTSALEGYVPDTDATVVTRILDAGGEITGEGGVREPVLLRRQPHERERADPQSARPGTDERGLVRRQRGARRSG